MRLTGTAAVLAVSLLTSCATAPARPGTAIPIARGVELVLPAVQPFGAGLQLVQLVRARSKTRTETLQAIIESDATQLSIIITLPSGPRVASIVWRPGDIVTTMAPNIPEQDLSAHLLADLMTLYAPAPVLAASLRGGAVTEDGGQRNITAGGVTVITAIRQHPHDWQGAARLTNLSYGYQLDISGQPLG
jgi:hypothetical protein